MDVTLMLIAASIVSSCSAVIVVYMAFKSLKQNPSKSKTIFSEKPALREFNVERAGRQVASPRLPRIVELESRSTPTIRIVLPDEIVVSKKLLARALLEKPGKPDEGEKFLKVKCPVHGRWTRIIPLENSMLALDCRPPHKIVLTVPSSPPKTIEVSADIPEELSKRMREAQEFYEEEEIRELEEE